MAFTLFFRRYAPFATFGLGFEGDHRAGPSTSLLVTARTIGCVPFDRGRVGALSASSSGTQYSGGGEALRRLLGRHFSTVSGTVTTTLATATRLSFRAQAVGANPMVPKAPDIDTFIDVDVEWITSSLRIRGSVYGDDFPNAEVFVRDAKGVGCLLFDGRTTGGRDTGPMTRLAGAHASQLLGTFSCVLGLAPDGTFLAPRGSCAITTLVARSVPAHSSRVGVGGHSGGARATGRW